jgi:Cytidylate kinase-like family
LPSRIICVSHTTGAGGEGVGRAVSDRLAFRYVDDEVIESAADLVGLDPAVVSNVERRKSLVARVLDRVAESGGERRPRVSTSLGGSARGQATFAEPVRQMPSGEDLRALIRDVIRDVAEEGDVVIVAHAASMALAGREDVLRVLVTASPETRARRLAETTKVDMRQADKAIRDSDGARADYLARFYGVERELPTHYDLVVNTDVVSPDRAADLLLLAAT